MGFGRCSSEHLHMSSALLLSFALLHFSSLHCQLSPHRSYALARQVVTHDVAFFRSMSESEGSMCSIRM